MKSPILVICTLILLSACGKTEPPVTDPAIVASNQQALESCLANQNRCRGGFMKEYEKNLIVRVGTESCSDCELVEIKFRTLEQKTLNRLASRLEWIVPPDPSLFGDTPPDPGKTSQELTQWEKASIMYARQFVQKKSR